MRRFLLFGNFFVMNLTRLGVSAGDSAMIWLLANITKNFMRAIRSEMTELFAVVRNYRMARMNIMTGLITMSAGTGLTIIVKVDKNIAKAGEIRNMLLYFLSVVWYAILHTSPAFFTEITTAVVENITIFRQSLNDSRVRHLIRGIKNLHIG